jgi:gliding motility-associated-like protein
VTVSDQNGCTWSSAFNVPASPSIEIELHADMMAAGYDSVTITVEVNIPLGEVDTLIWLPENLFPPTAALCLEQTILMPAQQTEIMVMAMDTNGCIAEARLLLDDDTNIQVYIPNVFTPNGDGINDLFTLYGNKNVEQVLELRIFDRWGNLIFVNNHFPPDEVNYGWDGSFRNLKMNPAVYVYWARVRFIDGLERLYKGDISLVR